MEREQARILLQQVRGQIGGTTREAINWSRLLGHMEQMRPNEDAQIYEHLDRAFEGILEPREFPRYRDPGGHQISIPLDDYTLQITVTHRALGLEDIYGVDIVYSIAGWKALAFQHKKRNRTGHLVFSNKERAQRNKIMALCHHCNEGLKTAKRSGYVMPLCASLYVIGDDRSDERHVVSACKVDLYRKSFPAKRKRPPIAFPLIPGLELADQMFLVCTIGMSLETQANRAALELVEDSMLARPDLLVRATLLPTSLSAERTHQSET